MRPIPSLLSFAVALVCPHFSFADDAPVRLSSAHWSGEVAVTVASGDNLSAIAGRYATTPSAVAADNGFDLTHKLKIGETLKVRFDHLVPSDLPDGITINLPQRLLYLRKEGELKVWAVALGKPSWPTPTGVWTVRSREENKTWVVPKSIQAEMAREGKAVKTAVGPGPDNPLGKFWLGLSLPGYGIHGTIAPSSIYRFRSHGCIRMNNDDIADLFPRVARGTPGQNVYWPVLLEARPDGPVYVEAHADAYRRAGDRLAALRQLAEAQGVATRIDWIRAAQVIKTSDGVPADVSLPAASAPKPAAAGTP